MSAPPLPFTSLLPDSLKLRSPFPFPEDIRRSCEKCREIEVELRSGRIRRRGAAVDARLSSERRVNILDFGLRPILSIGGGGLVCFLRVEGWVGEIGFGADREAQVRID